MYAKFYKKLEFFTPKISENTPNFGRLCLSTEKMIPIGTAKKFERNNCRANQLTGFYIMEILVVKG